MALAGGPPQPLEEDRFTLIIHTANAAFHDPGTDGVDTEIVRILRKLADKIERESGDIFALLDLNGNNVGLAQRA